MNMFARFDKNTAMTLQDITETKSYGRTDARTDNMKTVYPPQTKFAGGIKTIFSDRNKSFYRKIDWQPLKIQIGQFNTYHIDM